MIVVNIRHDRYDVYGGRPRGGKRPQDCRPGIDEGWLGNPHNLGLCKECGQFHDRAGAIRAHQTYFEHRIANDPVFRAAVLDLHTRRTGCFCAPRACHLDVVAEWVNIAAVDPAIQADAGTTMRRHKEAEGALSDPPESPSVAAAREKFVASLRQRLNDPIDPDLSAMLRNRNEALARQHYEEAAAADEITVIANDKAIQQRLDDLGPELYDEKSLWATAGKLQRKLDQFNDVPAEGDYDETWPPTVECPYPF